VVLLTLALAQIAFDKGKVWLFALLGVACGYATGIRIMGVMYALLIIFLMLIDMVLAIRKRKTCQIYSGFSGLQHMLLCRSLCLMALYMGAADR
jgi:uncharacterized membrane protein